MTESKYPPRSLSLSLLILDLWMNMDYGARKHDFLSLSQGELDFNGLPPLLSQGLISDPLDNPGLAASSMFYHEYPIHSSPAVSDHSFFDAAMSSASMGHPQMAAAPQQYQSECCPRLNGVQE